MNISSVKLYNLIFAYYLIKLSGQCKFVSCFSSVPIILFIINDLIKVKWQAYINESSHRISRVDGHHFQFP